MRLLGSREATSLAVLWLVCGNACGTESRPHSTPAAGGSDASAGQNTASGGVMLTSGGALVSGGGAPASGGNSAGKATGGSVAATGGVANATGGVASATGGVASATGGANEAGAGGDGAANAGRAGDGGAAGTAAACPSAGTATARGTLPTPPISEASGLAASWRSPNVFYAVNDSGSSPDVYALNASGELLASINVEGALKEDWEDVSVGPGPDANKSYVYVADIGDNDRLRTTSIVIHRIEEPELDVDEREQELRATPVSLYLRYPDGAHNAETLLVDPLNSDFYVITKGDSDGSRVYVATAPHSTTNVVELTYLLSLPFGEAPLGGNALATSGTVRRDGGAILLRSYDTAFFWPRQAGESLATALKGAPCALPISGAETQGEGITFAADGASYFTLGEGNEPTLYEFSLTYR